MPGDLLSPTAVEAVLTNPDLLRAVLAAIHAPNTKTLARETRNWCAVSLAHAAASRVGADDAWGKLARASHFPTEAPAIPGDPRANFYALCHDAWIAHSKWWLFAHYGIRNCDDLARVLVQENVINHDRDLMRHKKAHDWASHFFTLLAFPYQNKYPPGDAEAMVTYMLGSNDLVTVQPYKPDLVRFGNRIHQVAYWFYPRSMTMDKLSLYFNPGPMRQASKIMQGVLSCNDLLNHYTTSSVA